MRRLDLTPEQKDERTREQTRLRVSRYRERRNAIDMALHSVTDGVTSADMALHSVTPASLPARDDVRGTALVTTITSSTPPLPPTPSRRPNKVGELIDLLRAAGVAHALCGADYAELKRTSLSAAQVAEVYVAIATKAFGDAWLYRHLTVVQAVKTWPAYQNEKTRGPHAGGRKSNGTQVLEVFGYAAGD